MKTIKFGNRELNIKYGYKATLRGGLLKKNHSDERYWSRYGVS